LLTEFAYNNTYQDTAKALPFYANYGYHSRFNPEIHDKMTTSISVFTKKHAKYFWDLHNWLVKTVKLSQNAQAKFYDAKHKPVEFNVGDKVWLAARNTKSEQASKKLDWKKISPYRIIAKVETQAYCLELPSLLRIHPIFHVSLLEQYHENTIPGRIAPPPPLILIDGHQEYEVEAILDSK